MPQQTYCGVTGGPAVDQSQQAILQRADDWPRFVHEHSAEANWAGNGDGIAVFV